MDTKEPTTPKFRVRLDIAYDGSLFMGWQRQAKGSYTIQGVLEEKISQIFKTPITIQGSGRTDRGVHALMQVAHFNCPKDPRTMNLKMALQSLLPHFIVIKRAYLAPNDFHSLRSAENKTYKYLIRNHPNPSALKWNKSYWVRKPLNIEYLNEITNVLIGTHDFKSFQNAGTDIKNTVRTITEAHWHRKGPWVIFTITGTGFLKQMVRNIVGTILALQKQENASEKLKKILLSCDRKMALKTAAAEGLYLVRVQYPKDVDALCLKL